MTCWAASSCGLKADPGAPKAHRGAGLQTTKIVCPQVAHVRDVRTPFLAQQPSRSAGMHMLLPEHSRFVLSNVSTDE